MFRDVQKFCLFKQSAVRMGFINIFHYIVIRNRNVKMWLDKDLSILQLHLLLAAQVPLYVLPFLKWVCGDPHNGICTEKLPQLIWFRFQIPFVNKTTTGHLLFRILKFHKFIHIVKEMFRSDNVGTKVFFSNGKCSIQLWVGCLVDGVVGQLVDESVGPGFGWQIGWVVSSAYSV